MKASRQAFLALLGIALALFAYSNSYTNDFHFADVTAVTDNPGLARHYDLGEIFTRSDIGNTDSHYQRYQPLSTALLLLNHASAGIDPRPYRKVSIGLFFVLSFTLWSLYRKLASSALFEPTTTNWVPLLAAAIFLLSAVQAETVNYISAWSSIIAAISMTLSFSLLLAGKSARRSKLYLLPLSFAALHSEIALAFPVLLGIYLYRYCSEPNEPFDRRLQRTLIGSLSSLLVVGGFSLLALSLSHPQAVQIPDLEAVIFFPYALLLYFISFVYPFSISASPSLGSGPSQEQLAALCGFIFLCAVIALAVAALREKKLSLLGLGLVWYVVGLTPQLLVVSDAGALFDYRRALFSFGGLALSLSQACYLGTSALSSQSRTGKRYRLLAGLIALSLLASHVLVTRQRNRVWSSEESLWFDVLRHNPADGHALMQYGVSKMLRGDTDIARMYFEQALQRLPNEPALYEKLGTLHGIITLDQTVAESNFKRAIELDSERSETYSSYARWLYERKRYDAAIEAADRAIQLNAQDTTPYYTLLDSYDRMGRWSKVVETAQFLLKIAPEDAVALRLLAQADQKIRQRKH